LNLGGHVVCIFEVLGREVDERLRSLSLYKQRLWELAKGLGIMGLVGLYMDYDITKPVDFSVICTVT